MAFCFVKPVLSHVPHLFHLFLTVFNTFPSHIPHFSRDDLTWTDHREKPKPQNPACTKHKKERGERTWPLFRPTAIPERS